MSDSLNRIENIVVLMLENRSFDTILGALYPNSAQFEGLKFDGSMFNTYNGQRYPVTNESSTSPYVTPTPDPGESFPDMNLQIFNTTNPAPDAVANMGGFVNDWMATKEQYADIPTGAQCFLAEFLKWPDLPRKVTSPGDIMFYFTTAGPSPQLPVTAALAQSFGVSDAWFGSAPTQTYPNRFFVNCATSGGYVNDINYLCDLELFPKFPSIFELLDGGGPYDPANWKVYFHDVPLARLIDYVFHAPDKMVTNFDTSDRGWFSTTPTFAQDIEHHTLPRYSFIEPRYDTHLIENLQPNDNHPPYDVRLGEILVGTVYNLLRASSHYWPRTLLIITYDEHGGCFDHVIPPAATPPGGTPLPKASSFPFNRYGPRVPAILVSPYIPAGSIIRPLDFAYVPGNGAATTDGVTPFDHTSVIRTIVERFQINNGGQPAYLTQRDLNAPSLATALTLDATKMNNGPASIVLPLPDSTIAQPPGDTHLAGIYAAIMSRFATQLSSSPISDQ